MNLIYGNKKLTWTHKQSVPGQQTIWPTQKAIGTYDNEAIDKLSEAIYKRYSKITKMNEMGVLSKPVNLSDVLDPAQINCKWRRIP